jgi:hypothetical protein
MQTNVVQEGLIGYTSRGGGLTGNCSLQITICISCTYSGSMETLFPLGPHKALMKWPVAVLGVMKHTVATQGACRKTDRDLTHIIHERFCYNRQSAASLVKRGS